MNYHFGRKFCRFSSFQVKFYFIRRAFLVPIAYLSHTLHRVLSDEIQVPISLFLAISSYIFLFFRDFWVVMSHRLQQHHSPDTSVPVGITPSYVRCAASPLVPNFEWRPDDTLRRYMTAVFDESCNGVVRS